MASSNEGLTVNERPAGGALDGATTEQQRINEPTSQRANKQQSDDWIPNTQGSEQHPCIRVFFAGPIVKSTTNRITTNETILCH